MVSLFLFHLKRWFSINFANNLIEKYQMSAATVIINAQIPFFGWGGSSAMTKERGE
jgi:hypothetical protein